MDNNYYTVDQVAKLLEMHPKTIRKFIREGKLQASRVGKQYRITGHDLSVFTGSEQTEMIVTGQPSEVKVSTVVDMDNISSDEAQKISNLLLASTNHRDEKYGQVTLKNQYIKSENKLRIMIWGNLEFTQIMLESIQMLVEDRDDNL
ncbi:MAG: helix-turn-helix domain-containing protein [Clostridiales bacterium]|nr:helix-turn-helix domain-containing protein [Clostridiales bacterium]